MTSIQTIIVRALERIGCELRSLMPKGDDAVAFEPQAGIRKTVRYFPSDDLYQVVTRTSTETRNITVVPNQLSLSIVNT